MTAGFVVTFVTVFFARPLSTIRFFGWSLPFFVASQGAIFAYVAIVWIYAFRLRQLDRRFRFERDQES